MGAIFGWRGRVGFIAPAAVADTPIYHFYRIVPEGVGIVTNCMGIHGLTDDSIGKSLENVDFCADKLASFNADIIVLGGSPPAVHLGKEGERELCERIAKRTGLPATTSQLSALEAFNALESKRIVFATPFPHDQNEKLAAYLEEKGYPVAAYDAVDVTHEQIRSMPPEAIYRLAKQALGKADGKVDCIYLPCAAWHTIDIINQLEEDTGLNVVTSIQAMIWRALKLIDIPYQTNDYGRLFSEK